MINLVHMRTNLLVVTPQVSFGELIRQSVGETGPYEVHVVKNVTDAVQVAQSELCTLALMDIDLGEEVLLEIGSALRAKNPEIQLILMADEDLPPAMDAIRPWVLLRKPFYLPDFIELIQTTPIAPDELVELLQEQSVEESRMPAAEHAAVQGLVWLNDVSKAAQHLTRLTLESSAQAALITRDQELWAYAGGLSQQAANELARIVSRHWDAQKGNDLLRFVRLEATKAEHMLYATQMAPDVIFALTFDAETPFSTIRSQAGDLAQSLSISNPDSITVQKPAPAPASAPTSAPAPVPTSTPVSASAPPPPSEQEQAKPEVEVEDYDGAEEDIEVPSIMDILNEIPPPTPELEQAGLVLAPESEQPEGSSGAEHEVPLEATRPSAKSLYRPAPADTRPLHPREAEASPSRSSQSTTELDEDLGATVPSKPQERRPATPVSPPVPGELEQTRPHSTTERSGRMIVESASAAMAQLNYACLLLPRLTAHYLTGDIADNLSKWIPDICVAFGWRLEFLAVRPEYLQWVANVMPNTSPGYVMRVMRLQTSERIFEEFPRLKRENPSGDFWAPGYLIMSSLQPHPPQLVKDYIVQIRRRQGIAVPGR